MKPRRTKRIFEPPAILLTDLAFNLVIFFVVCASTEPATGRKQTIPSSSKEQQAAQANYNIEVGLTRTTIVINGEPTAPDQVVTKLEKLLAGKTTPQDRMVVVKSDKMTPYSHWIQATGLIEQAGGVVTVQLEESRDVVVP
jgi:biopolymer transport protein ExbD